MIIIQKYVAKKWIIFIKDKIDDWYLQKKKSDFHSEITSYWLQSWKMSFYWDIAYFNITVHNIMY